MTWRKAAVLLLPPAVLFFALGFVVGLELRRGPNWRLELEEYLTEEAARPATVERVVRARRPGRFHSGLGDLMNWDDVTLPFPPDTVRCVLLRRGAEGEAARQVVFLVRHDDALYRVAWWVYEGPREPFSAELEQQLETLGCDLGVR